MLAHLRRAIVSSIVLFLLCGLAYPLAITGVAQLFFKGQADGDLVSRSGALSGSTLIGQSWADVPCPAGTGAKTGSACWFQGRPDPDNPMETGSQNYGPKSKLLLDFSRGEVRLLDHEGITPTNDLVTGSGSGIDPDITPADAYAQVDAISRNDHVAVATLRALVRSHTVGAYWGFLGSPYIDVLQLNEALAASVH